ISFSICEHRFFTLKGRGVHVVQINRLTTEKQCREACQSPGASGNRHCNWSMPYQNHCIFLQCHQLSVCQNAGEQDIKDLLGEFYSYKTHCFCLFEEIVSSPQKKERMLNAQVDQHSVENLFSSTAQTHKIHLRHLLGFENENVTANTSKSITSSATTPTAPAVTTNITNGSVFITTYETTAKASNAPGGSDTIAKTMQSTTFSPTSGNIFS
ncbi:hypothetical protein N305_03430, partial [Manacus vitellinus]